MPRASIKKNTSANIPSCLQKKNEEIEKIKAELKKINAELAAEKRKGRQSQKEHEETVRRLIDAEEQADWEFRCQASYHREDIKDTKREIRETRVKLKEANVELKLATSKKVKEDHVKADQETKKRLERRNKELTEALEKGLDKKPWRECEMCFQEFEEDGDRVPQLLKCGHTFCWGCIQKLAKKNYIRCPVDRTMFLLKKHDNISHLKKNFRAMDF